MAAFPYREWGLATVTVSMRQLGLLRQSRASLRWAMVVLGSINVLGVVSATLPGVERQLWGVQRDYGECGQLHAAGQTVVGDYGGCGGNPCTGGDCAGTATRLSGGIGLACWNLERLDSSTHIEKHSSVLILHQSYCSFKMAWRCAARCDQVRCTHRLDSLLHFQACVTSRF